MNEAAMAALEEKQMTIGEGSPNTRQWVIKASHFEKALQKISPSVSDKVQTCISELFYYYYSTVMEHCFYSKAGYHLFTISSHPHPFSFKWLNNQYVARKDMFAFHIFLRIGFLTLFLVLLSGEIAKELL